MADVSDVMQELVEEYRARTRRSAAMHDQLCRYLPGGQTRSIAYFEPYPLCLVQGEGAVVSDADGNQYIDVLNNYTSLVHGHAHPPTVEAARRALVTGTAFPAPHESQLALSALLHERYPAAERVRFTNSGSEATMLALRIARRATGRDRVVAFEGAYHGTVAELADGGPNVVRIPYNDPAAARGAIDASTAAVVAEPFLGSGGVIPAEPGFLELLQERACAAQALFVLDEVQGARNAFHGMHGASGLTPDLVLMGKVIGGGFPVGVVAGRADLLGLTDARRPDALAHSGTFNGNVVTMRAGLASLDALDDVAIGRLNAGAVALAGHIEAAGARAAVPVSVTRSGSIMQVHLAECAPSRAVAAAGRTARVTAALHLALVLEGVYAAPRGMLNLSTALSAEQLEDLASSYERAFGRINALVAEASPMATGR